MVKLFGIKSHVFDPCCLHQQSAKTSTEPIGATQRCLFFDQNSAGFMWRFPWSQNKLVLRMLEPRPLKTDVSLCLPTKATESTQSTWKTALVLSTDRTQLHSGLTYKCSIYNFSTYNGAKAIPIHRNQNSNFEFWYFSGLAMCATILSLDAGQQASTPSQPLDQEGKQPWLNSVVCCQHFWILCSENIWGRLG